MAKRHFSIEEQAWFETKKLFEEEYESLGAPPMNQTKEEMYQSLGRHYDAVFEERAEMSMEEFVKEYPTYFTFLEMVEYKLTGKKTDRKKRERVSKEDKLMHRLDHTLISEKRLGYAILKNEDVFDINYKVFWIADIIAWCITQKYDLLISGEERKKIVRKGSFNVAQEMQNYYEALKAKDGQTNYFLNVPSIHFNGALVREKTGLRISNAEIHKLVKEFITATSERKFPRYIEGDRWVEPFVFKLMFTLAGEKSGKVSPRGAKPEYDYCCVFDRAESLEYLLSVRLGFFDCRPPSYYRLSGKTQHLVRALCWSSEDTNRSLEELCKIAGIKSKNVTMQKKYITRHLNEARDAGYLAGGKVYPKRISGQRKKEYRYKIVKVKRLPEK